MLDLIASDLWYVSLIRLIDVEKLGPYWAASASLAGARDLTVTGPTPDATLATLVMHAITSPTFLPTTPATTLDQLEREMLRLLLIRPRLSTDVPHLWTATAWMRGHVVLSAVGEMPSVALHNLVLLIPRQPMH